MSGRSCTRCGRPLDDAASQEAGIGPVCRKLDNALLAKSFDSDVDTARRMWTSGKNRVLPSALHFDVQKRMDAVESELWTIGHGPDWRTVVKSVEWLLSHAAFDDARPFLTSLVRSLGYVGLAALWDGDASTGAATVFFGTLIGGTAPMLFVSGPRNKTAKGELVRAGARLYAPNSINGCTLKTVVWGIPAARHAQFEHIVRSYYPCHTGLPDAVTKAQQVVTTMQQPAQPGAVDMGRRSTKACHIEEHVEAGKPTVYRVFTPFHAGFIAALKSGVPYIARRWNPTLKCWEVSGSHLSVAQQLMKEYFNTFAAPQEEAASAPAPVEAPKPVVKVQYTSASALPF